MLLKLKLLENLEISRWSVVVVEPSCRKTCMIPDLWDLQQSVVAGVCKSAVLLWEFTAAQWMPRTGSLWPCEEQQGGRTGPCPMDPLLRPVPVGSSPAHRSSALPQKQCLTGPSQHQLCSTTWQFRLSFYGTFPPHVSISFFIQRRRYRYVYSSIEHEVLHESRSTLVITSLPAVPFSRLCLLLPSKTHGTCALLTCRKSKFAEEQIDTVWLSSMLIY